MTLCVIGFIIGIAAERLRSGSIIGLGGRWPGTAADDNDDMPGRGDVPAECSDDTWLRLLGPLLLPV